MRKVLNWLYSRLICDHVWECDSKQLFDEEVEFTCVYCGRKEKVRS